jgi:hypothetical protein
VSELGESTELANELVLEADQEDASEHKSPRWHTYLALSTLLMAILTAMGALLAGMTAHEALLEKTEEVVELTILEADRVEVDLIKAKHEILISLGESPDPLEVERIEVYQEETDELGTVIQHE